MFMYIRDNLYTTKRMVFDAIEYVIQLLLSSGSTAMPFGMLKASDTMSDDSDSIELVEIKNQIG